MDLFFALGFQAGREQIEVIGENLHIGSPQAVRGLAEGAGEIVGPRSGGDEHRLAFLQVDALGDDQFRISPDILFIHCCISYTVKDPSAMIVFIEPSGFCISTVISWARGISKWAIDCPRPNRSSSPVPALIASTSTPPR